MDDLPFAYAGVQGVAEVVDVVLLTTFINCGPSVWSRFVFFFIYFDSERRAKAW